MSDVSLKYIKQLDGLRCFAIISVMIGHFISWETESNWVKHTPWGHGVILFFVLSGYLITQILLRQKHSVDSKIISIKQSLITFYSRRLLRIFPIYYLLIAFLFWINFENTREIFPWLATHSTNLYQCINNVYVGQFNHFWSLAIEEQFYLFWPLLILLIPKNKTLNVIIIVALLSVLSRVFLGLFYQDKWMAAAYFTSTQFFPLSLGALLALHNIKEIKLIRLIDNSIFTYIIVFIYLISYYVFSYKLKLSWFNVYIDEYLFAIMSFSIVNTASKNGFKFILKNILEHDIVVFTGKISYGMYLFHLFVPTLFWNYISVEYNLHLDHKGFMWFMYFVLTYLLAIASYYAIELHFNKLKKFFSYK